MNAHTLLDTDTETHHCDGEPRRHRCGAFATSSGADLTLSGTLQDLAVDAKSGVGSTEITTTSKIAIQARNVADGSHIRMTLRGSSSDRVFWFDPEDAQEALDEVLI